MLEDIIVLGGGWSVSQYNLRDIEKRGFLISCNESAILTKPQIALSMDRLWAEHRFPTLCAQGVPDIYLREGTAKNFIPVANNSIVHMFKFSEDYRLAVESQRAAKGEHPDIPMTAEQGRLNGSNSGTMALNLAYQKFAPRVFLLGFDMCKGPGFESYWHSPYPWAPNGATSPGKYKEWAPEFDFIARQFQKVGTEVFNVNHRSAIEAFKKISFKEFLGKTA